MKNISAKEKTLSARKDYPLLNYFLYFIFTLYLVLLCINKISGDDDFFWHLATGRYIVENKTVPSADVFSYTTIGQRWIPFEWGWDVLTYIIYSSAGFTGLYILKTLLILLIFFIYYKILEKFDINHSVRILFLLFLSWGVLYRFTMRPHLISYLFFSLILYIIISYKYFHRHNYKFLFYLPLIFWVWANFHMGIIAGFLLFGIYVISEIIIFYFPAINSTNNITSLNKKELLRLLIVFFVSLIVIIINPNNITTFLYAYSHTKLKLLEDISEWKSPFDAAFNSSVFIILYKSFLAASLFILYYSIKKKDLLAFLILIVFTVYSVRALRFITDYTYIVSPFIFLSIYYLINKIKNVKIKNIISYSWTFKFILCVVMLFFIFNIPNNRLFIDYFTFYRIWGTGTDNTSQPTQMFDFAKNIKLNEIGQHPLNHYDCGGLFLWTFPKNKNFIDSRNLSDEIYSDYDVLDYMKPGFEEKLKKYDIDYAMYYVVTMIKSPDILNQIIVSYFSKNDKEWKLIYWDDKSFIYVKNLPKYEQIIFRYEYKYINPYNYLFQKKIIDNALINDKETVLKEIKRKKSEEPDGFIINTIIQFYKIK